jgi:putative hydrolase of the HAD superfamily
MVDQCLLIDGDDTLWENNVHFERAIEEFLDVAAHGSMTSAELRRVLDEIEQANSSVHGYGARVFVRSLHECYARVHAREASGVQARVIAAFGERILGQEPEIIAGVRETLAYLRQRHRLVLLTKGDLDEQAAKVDRSGLRMLFEDVVIVPEKTVDVYISVVERLGAQPDRTWMIGNSPRSDILPAITAGLRAVFVPHADTWALERQPVPDAPDRLLLLDRFSDLMAHF